MPDIGDVAACQKWWGSLDEDVKPVVAPFVEMCVRRKRRDEFNKKKFRMVGWRGWAANVLPLMFGVHSLTYIGWWGLPVFWIGGGIVMRLLINLYDNLRGNPRDLGSRWWRG
jgi:hypothetical protein